MPKFIFKGLVVVLLLSTVVFVLSWGKKTQLPPLAQILPVLKEEPVQTPTERTTFNLDYRGKKYRIDPQADYEIWGLVVSHNNINSMGDIYHDSDAVDIKDIALIWGSNVSTADYLKVEFKSNCYVVNWRYPRGTKFDNYKIANNHLLSGDPKVREIIQKARVGDQVRLKGMLVNYTAPTMRGVRKSSLTRNDTDMGACEVIYVEEADIIKVGNPLWRYAFIVSKWVAICLASTTFLGFGFVVWRDSRAINRKDDD